MKSCEQSLQSLFGRGCLKAQYQPQVDLQTGKLVGFEVLARWVTNGSGTVPPSRFLPILEKNGTVGCLTASLLEDAFQLSSALPSVFRLSVNVSPLELEDVRLPQRIRALGDAFSFDLSRLTIELTESTPLPPMSAVKRVLHQLKELGLALALDDFGTGYSHLLCLQALPFDQIKLDRCLIQTAQDCPKGRKIVAASLDLAKSLCLTTVAEGIEEPRQAALLRELGCELAQGWLYGRPIPRGDVERTISTFASAPFQNIHARVSPSSDLQIRVM